MEHTVTIPQWEASYLKSEKTRAKYWLWKDREKLPKKHATILRAEPLIQRGLAYCCNADGERFIKNTNKAGKENRWILNGQELYNAKLNWRMRKTIAKYYHDYFKTHIENQISTIDIPDGRYLSVGCDIYDVERGNMPDADNMWLLEKFFNDALQEAGKIPDDSPDIIREAGRKRYHFVETAEERKLVFTIKLIS